MMRQSPYTFSHQIPAQGTNKQKQKPSPPPRYHDLVDRQEMGIIISRSPAREAGAWDDSEQKAARIEVEPPVEPRSVTVKMMVIIFALIILGIFAGTLFAIARLNRIEMAIKSDIRKLKMIIQKKADLWDESNSKEDIAKEGYDLVDTRLRIIDFKLQNFIDSHDEVSSTSQDNFNSEDDVHRVEYSYDELSTDAYKDRVEEYYPSIEYDNMMGDASTVEVEVQAQVVPSNKNITDDVDMNLNYDYDEEESVSGLE